MESKTARFTLLIDPNKKKAFEALCAQEMAEFDPEAARRKGYFDNARELRKSALAKARGRK